MLLNERFREALTTWAIRIGLVTLALLTGYSLLFGN
jgi:hypothetical protein